MAKRANGSFDFTFVNHVLKWTGQDGKSVVFDCMTVPEYKAADDYIRAVLVNGWKQKIADAGALPANKETGHPAPVAEKIAAMQRVVDALVTRSWSAGREAPNVGFVTELLKRAYPKRTADWVSKQVAGMSAAELAALIAKPPVAFAPIVAAIKAERVAVQTAGIDTEAMFKKLDKM